MLRERLERDNLAQTVLMAVGGFRESFGCNYCNTCQGMRSAYLSWLKHHAGDEETEFCIRAAQQWPGSVWFYTPSALVRHHVAPQRTSWAYFLWRCYDEGLGTALLVKLHGWQAALSSERTYRSKILPRAVAHGLTDVLFHHDLTGLKHNYILLI